MNRRGHRGRMGAIVVLAIMLTSGVLATRDAMAEAVEFDIAAQPLAQALNRWAEQAGLQIIWPAGDPRADSTSPAVRGSFEPMQALHTLLDGTRLTYSVIGEGRTISIQGQRQTLRIASSPEDSAQAEGEREASERGGLASSLTGGATSAQQNDERGLLAAAAARSDEGKQDRSPRTELVEEILVTGSRLEGRGEGVSPVTTFDRTKLDELG